MRSLFIGRGHGMVRGGAGKTVYCLMLAALALVFAGSPAVPVSSAYAKYSTQQAKMAGRYERRPRQATTRNTKRKYKNASRKSYGKSSRKQTYKRSRSGKQRYARKRTRTKAAGYRKSNSRKTAHYKSKKKRVKVASLSPSYVPQPQKSLSGGGVRWVASAGCLNGTLKSVIYQVAARFGPVTVSSTCRNKARNARAGGARKSHHLTGNAADFRVHANQGAAFAYLKSLNSIGGYKHYGGGLFHIDTGPRRTW